MSFQGTRTKSGSFDIDRSTVGRGIALQFVLGIAAIAVGVAAGVPPGFLLLPTTLVAGAYVGLRTDNWGDEYMDGGAMGVVGGILAALGAGGLGAVVVLVFTDGAVIEVFLGSMVTVAIIVLVMPPLLGVFGALSAWYVAKNFGR
jgi:hypothetical protein